MNVLYFQRTRLEPGEEAALRASYRPLDTLLAQSDWVVPQLPGDPSTPHLIDGPRLARMKRGACLINVSRADVVERAALIAALLTVSRPCGSGCVRRTARANSTRSVTWATREWRNALRLLRPRARVTSAVLRSTTFRSPSSILAKSSTASRR